MIRNRRRRERYERTTAWARRIATTYNRLTVYVIQQNISARLLWWATSKNKELTNQNVRTSRMQIRRKLLACTVAVVTETTNLLNWFIVWLLETESVRGRVWDKRKVGKKTTRKRERERRRATIKHWNGYTKCNTTLKETHHFYASNSLLFHNSL